MPRQLGKGFNIAVILAPATRASRRPLATRMSGMAVGGCCQVAVFLYRVLGRFCESSRSFVSISWKLELTKIYFQLFHLQVVALQSTAGQFLAQLTMTLTAFQTSWALNRAKIGTWKPLSCPGQRDTSNAAMLVT